MSSPPKPHFTDRESAAKWFEETFVTDNEYILAANLMRMQQELRKQNEVLRKVVEDLSELVGLPSRQPQAIEPPAEKKPLE
jgi:hypothetical protein